MVKFDQSKPYQKRLAIVADTFDGIQRFGSNNLYPQICEEIAKNSFTLKSSLARVADFINGEGFADPAVGKLVVNKMGLTGGETLDDILKRVSLDYAGWNTLVLHFNYDLNYRICSITQIPFSYIRLDVQDETGRVNNYKYSYNWEQDGRRYLQFRNIETYDKFNPDPMVVKAQIEEAGGILNYKGQVLYLTPRMDEYPIASYDSVLEHAQAQYEAGLYKLAITQNQFSADIAIVYPGEFESQDEKQSFTDLIESRSGARNAGKRIGIQDKSGTKKASDMFQVLTPANVDKQYEYTENSSRDAIMENEALPKELLGVRPESGMFNQDNMENAYTYFNAITRNRRAALSRAFAHILKFWQVPIITEALIKPQQYIVDGQSGTEGVDVRDNLANMSGRQAQNMGRIIRKYAKGEYTYEQAKVLLQGGFGLSNEEIDKLLGTTEEEPAPAAPTAPAEKGATMTNLGKALKMKDEDAEFALNLFGFKSTDWIK